MLFTSIPLSGFAKVVGDRQESANSTDHAAYRMDYGSGNTQEELRMPIATASYSEPELAGEVVEVNQYSKVYKTGEKTYSAVYSPIPNFYYDENGDKQEYDNSFELDNDTGTNEFTNKSSDIDVVLSADFTQKGLTFEYNGVKVGLVPTEGDYSTYLISGNSVRYNNVYEGIDVQYTVDELGIHEYIILNRLVEKNIFSYKLEKNGNKVELIDNTLYVYDGRDKSDYAYTISAPVMTDAAGVSSDAITMTLKGDMITITADSEWLTAAERAYPVYIDPDITIDSALAIRSVVEIGDRVYVSYPAYAYGYAGYIEGSYFGFSGNLGRSKMLVYIPDGYFDDIPKGAGILSATFNIYQYVSPLSSTNFWCHMITDSWDIDSFSSSNTTKGYSRAGALNTEYLSSSQSKKGYHSFDVRTAVNNWVNGLDAQNGLMITGQYNTASEKGGAFVTPNTTSGTPGAGSYAQYKPNLVVSWEIPNPVDTNYPLNNTTINLRTINTSSRDGKLAILGVFADGVAKPNSSVDYVFSDSSAENQSYTVTADISYKYPDSTAWNDTFASQGRATKYKDILSNWQTAIPFTKFEYNRVYNWTATASLDGNTGNTAKSADFLVYKITRYDTLASIAKYYGVSVDQLATDNHVQDMLLIENNTIIVINPTQNATVPYNPGTLTDDEKAKIDGLLIGRAKHCEFGFEPVNLNTGNFYMSQTDISIPDYNGNFEISRTNNSKTASVNSVFGRGWQFAYSQSLSKLSANEIIYRRGDGSAIYFTYSNGKWECASGYYLTLTPIAIETKLGDFGGEELEEYTVYEYEIKDAGGTVYRFGSQGLLKSVTDKKSFVTTLTYDSLYNISSITSPAGTIYTIQSDAEGRITKVTVPNGSFISYSYDENGNLASYADEVGNTVHYHYDSEHRMTSWSDGEGRTVTANEYDADGRVTKQTDSEGNITQLVYGDKYTKTTDANGNVTVYRYDDSYRTTSIEYADGSIEYKYYDADNNLSKAVARTGKETLYEYDADGFTTKITRFDGKSQSFVYDSNNNLASLADYDGKTESYTYDGKGNLLSMTKKDGSVKSFEYDDNCRVTKLTDENGHSTVYVYNGIWVSEVTAANGSSTQYYYNANGQVVTSIDANGNTTRYFYDAAGKNIGYQTADGGTVSYAYDKAGCMISMKNANGYTYSCEYDGLGNIIKLTDPLENAVTYTYDGIGNNISVSYDANHIASQSFDCFSQVVTATDEEGGIVSYAYDKAGNKVSVTDANNNTTKYTYDLRFNKVSSVIDALGNTTTYSYDDIGNLVKTISANGAVTEYEYDFCGNIVKKVEANGHTVTYTYDKVGNLLKSESNAGDSTVCTYDSVYNLTSVSYANGAKLTYTYDANGNKLTETDSKGATTKYTYDTFGRKISVEDAVGRKTAYAYDNNGNLLTEATSTGGVTAYSYDALDRNRQVKDALGNVTVMNYDSVGNLVSTTNAANETTRYAYNNKGLVIKTTDPLGGVLTMSYDKNGNLVKAVDAKGYEAIITYDALNRTASTTDALGLVTTFTYDSVGNLSNEKTNNGTNNTYEYDSVGNLVKNTDALGNEIVYSYDLNGNLLSVTAADGSVTSYTYDTLNNLTSMTNALGGKVTYSYDIIGNLIEKTTLNGGKYSYSYDLSGRNTSVTDPAGQTTKYEYNEFDLVTKTTDANGGVSKYEYDIGGNLMSETDANGNTTKYTYDNVYRLISVTYPNGASSSYTYDANDNRTSVTDANKGKTSYTFDALGNVTEITDAKGNKTAYTYDAAGNVLTEKDAIGAVTKNYYNKAGQLIKTVLANGATYTYGYDALGRTVKETQPEGLSTEYVYDSVGNVTAKIDQSGRKTSYSYDKLQRLTSTTDARGNVTKFVYDKEGNLTSLTTPNGNTTVYTYDSVDRLVNVADPTKANESYTYDGLGNVLKATQNGVRTTSYTYDKVGNLTSVTNASGSKKTLTYDSVNRLISETDYKGNKTAYTYDGNDNVLTQTDRIGATTNYVYDKLNNLISETDGEGRSKGYIYDAVNRLVSVTEDYATSTYQYDSVGNLISAGGYTYEYNLNGQKTSAKDALGNVTRYVYNANGMLQKVKNADGTSVDYRYNEIDELISKSYNETEEIALYGYDADGNRISMKDIAGTSDYEYDSLGKVTAINIYGGTSKITYSYNEYGELTKLGYPDGTSVGYEYNNLGQITSITNRDGEKTTYKYDTNGNVIEIHRPNDTYTLIEYDKNDRVSKLINYAIVDYFFGLKKTDITTKYEYSYDKSGNIVTERVYDYSSSGKFGCIARLIKKIFRERTEFSYDYDGRNQLTEVAETKVTLFKRKKVDTTTYAYDISGNRTQENANGTVTDYTYNEAGQLIKKTCGKDVVTYEYDANGNLVKENSNGILCAKNEKNYSYNAENRLTAVKENGKLLMAALYDGDNERIFTVSHRDICSLPCLNDNSCKNLDSNESGIDFDENLIKNTMLIPNGVTCSADIAKYDFTGYINNINAAYTQVLVEYGANNKITASYEYGVFRESAEIDGKDYFYEYDGKGSVVAVSNSSGSEVATYRYDAFGNTTAFGIAIANHFKYNGEYTDDATNLQYLRARYYRAETGSFITADIYTGNITSPLSLNRYTYVHNNPVMGKDPSGHFAIATALIVGASLLLGGGIVAGVSHHQKEKNKKNVSTTKNTIVTVENNKATADKSTSKTEEYKYSYKDQQTKVTYYFKTSEAASSYRQMCEELDTLNKDLAKYENNIKIAGIFEKVGLITGGAGLSVMSGGTSNFLLAGFLSGAGTGVISNTVTQTMSAEGSFEQKISSDLNYGELALSTGASAVTGLISGGINRGVTAKGTDPALKLAKRFFPKSQVSQKVFGRALTGMVSGTFTGMASNIVTQSVDIISGQSDEFNFGELGTQTLTSGFTGGVFGGISGYIEGKYIDRKITENRANQDKTTKANRQKTVGGTPSKDSKIGNAVWEHQLEEGTARINKETGVREYLDPSSQKWYTFDSTTQMGHVKGAAEWWTDGGYRFGTKSSEAKAFMNDASNYRFEFGSNNISKGQVDKKVYGYFWNN